MCSPRHTIAHFLEVEHGDCLWEQMTWHNSGAPVWFRKRRKAIRYARIVVDIYPVFRRLRQFRAMRIVYRGQVVWAWTRKDGKTS